MYCDIHAIDWLGVFFVIEVEFPHQFYFFSILGRKRVFVECGNVYMDHIWRSLEFVNEIRLLETTSIHRSVAIIHM